MRKIVTRNDVARRAGVSPAVVSFVLNNSNYVSEKKRSAVQKAVRDLGYFPNYLARGLKTRRSSHFALVCDEVQNDVFAAMEDVLHAKGYYLSVVSTRNEDSFIKMLIGRSFEGIFMMSNAFTVAQYNDIASQRIPMVLFKTRYYPGLSPSVVTVVPGYRSGVAKSVDYLVLKGHSRIAIVPPLKYITQGIHGDDLRVRAYVESLEKSGLPVDEALVCTRTQSVESVCESVFEMTTGAGVSRRPTAFVVGNDHLAALLMQYLRKLNLRVPEDVALIGSDNSAYASITSPPLTTVDYSKSKLAQTAIEKLVLIMDGKRPEDEYLEMSLVIRGSA